MGIIIIIILIIIIIIIIIIAMVGWLPRRPHWVVVFNELSLFRPSDDKETKRKQIKKKHYHVRMQIFTMYTPFSSIAERGKVKQRVRSRHLVTRRHWYNSSKYCKRPTVLSLHVVRMLWVLLPECGAPGSLLKGGRERVEAEVGLRV